jgi:hypothetical protein
MFSSLGFRSKFQEILPSCFDSNYGHRSIPKGAVGHHSPLIHKKWYVSRSRSSKASRATINFSCIIVAEPRNSTELLMLHESEPGSSNFHPDNPSSYDAFLRYFPPFSPVQVDVLQENSLAQFPVHVMSPALLAHCQPAVCSLLDTKLLTILHDLYKLRTSSCFLSRISQLLHPT